MPNLIKKIQNTCFREELYKKGSKIILAVSGGPDSVCLLNVFCKLQKKYDLKLLIAHVNYGLRQKDSDQDEKFVRELAKEYGLVCKVYKSPKIEKISENELRNIRYEFFEKVRVEKNFDFIAVAHNSDDQAETFLMRLIRGAGNGGLSAMKYKNNYIIRPLLATSRQEILAYLKTNQLKYRTDKTNQENLFLRNKIRNQLIPFLEKKFNPKIKQTIADSLVSISEDNDFLEKEAEKFVQKENKDSIEKIKKLHPAILRRVLRQKLEKEKGNLKNVSASQIEEILKIIKSDKNKRQIVLFQGLKISRIGDKLEIIKIS